MAFSIDGLVSGFDTSTIIESLLGFQQNQIDTLNSRKQEVLTKQSAFKGIEAQILTLQSSLTRLSRSTNSVFDAKLATSSNEDLLEVAASGGANNATYQLTVNSLATAHQVASQGFDSSSSSIAKGTISIGLGSGVQTTITIDDSNNTLSSLAQAINDQVADVDASIVFDQASSSYRLLMSSRKTGVDNTLTINNSLNSGTGIVPDFTGPAVQEASNAQVSLGSGPGAIVAEYASNEIEGLIEDVTISLKNASPGSTVTIDIQSDTTQATEAIQKFVEDFNNVMDFISAQTRYVAETEQASPLLGNRSVSTIKNRLLSTVTGSIDTGRSLSRLAQIGVDVNLSGKLELDTAKLEKALRGDLEGIESKDVRLLFGLNGETSNAGVRFVAGGPNTKATDSPIDVDITSAAERATITATNAISDGIVIDGTNNTLQLTVNGSASETLTLASGTYTKAELAAHLESVINASTELGVNDVNVSLSTDDKLVLTSEKYGAASQVSSVSGTALATLGFSGSEADNGQDVQGRFFVNGVEEIAKGNGRLLVGATDNEHTADLQVEVTLTGAEVTAGYESTLSVYRGVIGQLGEIVGDILDSNTGLLKTVDEDFSARIDLIDQSIARVQQTTEAKRDDLIREFTALESILSELQNTGDFIASQLTSITSSRSNNKK